MEKIEIFEACKIENMEKITGGRQKTSGGCFSVPDENGNLIHYTYKKDVIRNNGVRVLKGIERK